MANTPQTHELYLHFFVGFPNVTPNVHLMGIARLLAWQIFTLWRNSAMPSEEPQTIRILKY